MNSMQICEIFLFTSLKLILRHFFTSTNIRIYLSRRTHIDSYITLLWPHIRCRTTILTHTLCTHVRIRAPTGPNNNNASRILLYISDDRRAIDRIAKTLLPGFGSHKFTTETYYLLLLTFFLQMQ